MGTVLVDSNILLRLAQPAHAQYAVASEAVASLRKQNFDLCIATQNLVEFWVVATRPLTNNGLEMHPSKVAGEIHKLRNLFRLLEGLPGIADAWQQLVGRHLVLGKQGHDAHLVATMLVHGVRRILTFNVDDFRRYASVEVIAPTSASTAKL
jgi:predicted nucleic acid-binding protein